MSSAGNRQTRETYPFHFEINTRFTDTDQAGHLNNVSIFAYYQDGQARFMLDCLPELAAAPWRLRLTGCDVSYEGQTYYPDAIDVASGVEQVGDDWLRVFQALFQRGECVGLCDAVLVMTNDQQRPQSFTPEQRAQLESRRLRSLAAIGTTGLPLTI